MLGLGLRLEVDKISIDKLILKNKDHFILLKCILCRTEAMFSGSFSFIDFFIYL